ncbi:720_t:CDS:2, partial [Racocetra fulgida]
MKLNILAKDNSPFSLIPSSWFNSSELRECEFKFVVPNIQNTNVYNYINLISIRNKRIQIIHIITYNEDIPPNCRAPFLNLISAQTELKKLVLKYYSITTSSFMPLLRREMLQKELSNQIKEEIIFLLSQNHPNITTLCYVTNNLIFSSTLEKFHSLCQLQIGEFAYYYLPYSRQNYLQALIKYLPCSLKILSLLNIYDYSYKNLNCFFKEFDIEKVELEVFILPFNVELNLLPNLRKFIEKAKYLKYIEIVRSKNYNVEKQKD